MHPNWNTQPATRQPVQSQPSLDKTSSFMEEAYIPRQSSIIFSPLKNVPHNSSTVKISRPGEDVSRFTL